jgi:transposase-like protein
MNGAQISFPQTLQAAIVFFGDPQNCFNAAVALRWPNGIECPRCGSREHSFISTRQKWFCKGCKKQFSLKVNSIFEDSPLGMDKWMMAAWMLGNCKNGISSYEIARDLGITQKSAWFMLQRLRKSMQTGSFTKLSGAIEVDESWIGGKVRNMHKARKVKVQKEGRNTGGKTAVIGVLERNGEVRVTVSSKRSAKVIQQHIREHVEAGSAIFSDEFADNYRMDAEYKHEVVNHALEYVKGQVHCNGMENFWSLLKRGLHGTYISVEPFHLFRYVDEQVFRSNNRKELNDAERFAVMMANADGRRVTWKQLTGKVEERPEIV